MKPTVLTVDSDKHKPLLANDDRNEKKKKRNVQNQTYYYCRAVTSNHICKVAFECYDVQIAITNNNIWAMGDGSTKTKLTSTRGVPHFDDVTHMMHSF